MDQEEFGEIDNRRATSLVPASWTEPFDKYNGIQCGQDKGKDEKHVNFSREICGLCNKSKKGNSFLCGRYKK